MLRFRLWCRVCICVCMRAPELRGSDFQRRFYFIRLLGQQTRFMVSFGALRWRIWLQIYIQVVFEWVTDVPAQHSTHRKQYELLTDDMWHLKILQFKQYYDVLENNFFLMWFSFKCTKSRRKSSLWVEEAICKLRVIAEVVIEIEFCLPVWPLLRLHYQILKTCFRSSFNTRFVVGKFSFLFLQMSLLHSHPCMIGLDWLFFSAHWKHYPTEFWPRLWLL